MKRILFFSSFVVCITARAQQAGQYRVGTGGSKSHSRQRHGAICKNNHQ